MLITTYNLKYDSKYFENSMLNIKNALKIYDIDILLFQEAENYKKIKKILNKKYEYVLSKSGLEYQITFYKKSYKLIKVLTGEFEIGRPFQIIFFYDKYNDYNFLLINVHLGHYNIDKLLYNKISDIIQKEKIEIKYFMIGGDFNKKIDLIKFLYNKKIYELKNTKNNILTCCNENGINYKYDSDYVLCNKKPIKRINISKYYPSSDHGLIIIEL